MNFKAFPCLAALLALAILAPSAHPATAATAPVTLRIVDLTPDFLKFYQQASQAHLDEAAHWALWRKTGNLAPVPPTPQGLALARRLLDANWPRYPAAMARIRLGAAGLHPDPRSILQAVADRLDPQGVPIRGQLVTFVGVFLDNAFTAPGRNGVPTVYLPLEIGDARMTLTHEFTHVVNAQLAHLSLNWQRSIAQTIFMEGLAMRLTQQLVPGRPTWQYVTHDPRWFPLCRARQRAILRGIRPYLTASDSATVERFTFGRGTTGIQREAYCAGWAVVGDLLRRERAARLATLSAPEQLTAVRAAITSLVSSPAKSR